MAWKELYFHTVNPDIVTKMAEVRSAYIELGKMILAELPESRAKSLAKTHLEDSLMRAIQALALQGEEQPQGMIGLR